ncbi:MAG: beta-N-acetylhexosaminidase [Deltaproteobacteria bacterium]|nr:beta-N-acetylhexosaminidase [Deltaproteobacteria bacterium]
MLTDELRKNLGQIFMIAFEGVEPSAETMWLLENRHVGGVALFASNCPTLGRTFELVSQLKLKSPGLCLAIDHEGGRVHRLPKPFTHFPAMLKLGRLYEKMPSSQLAFDVGRAMGRELSAMGIHFNFAPVLDVHTNPLNHVIGDRAFSNDAEVVALVACQLIQGLQEMGVGACGKHFPGHGDTNEDSHELLPRLPHNLKRLEALELIPFAAAIQQKVAAIMTAHVVYNGLDKETPATFSVKLLRDLLTDKMGFEGMIVSDDLSMGAISKTASLEEACVSAFMAGCDLLLVGKNPKAQAKAIDFFVRAVEEERIPRQRVDQALQKIAQFKKQFCPRGVQRPDPSVIGCKEHQVLFNKINQLA